MKKVNISHLRVIEDEIDEALISYSIEMLETNVDDVTGQVLGNLIDELLAAGAIPLKSSPEPFIEYVQKLSKDRVTTKGDIHRLNKDDMKYIELFIGSDFFRKTFFGDYFLKNGHGIFRGMIYRSIEGKLNVRNAFHCINNALQSVIIQSMFLFKDFKDFYIKNERDIISSYSNFDDFLEKHFNNMQKKDLKSFIYENPKG